MSDLDAEVGAREDAGERARDEALMLDRLVETMRLASFRSYLLATVESMSALVPAVLGLVSSDAPSALQRIGPAHTWPSITKREAEYGRTEPKTNHRKKVDGRYVTRPAPQMGTAVIGEGALGDWVEANVFGGRWTCRCEAMASNFRRRMERVTSVSPRRYAFSGPHSNSPRPRSEMTCLGSGERYENRCRLN
jgi:hypothetical protein